MRTDFAGRGEEDPPRDDPFYHPAHKAPENKYTFFARLEPALAPSEIVRVRGAYYLAKFGHRAQFRKETDPEGFPLRYFEHVRRVAIILIDEARIYDPDLIITALLHDTLEDTEAIDGAIIEQFFGTRVARLVRLLTKDPKEGYVERLKSSPDALLVKACDRLDNLRSLEGADPAFQRKQCKETREVYLPLFIWDDTFKDRRLCGIRAQLVELAHRYQDEEDFDSLL